MITAYIRADNPAAAAHTERRFKQAAARLGQHPYLGRPGKIPDTREFIPHPSYRLVYEVRGQDVFVLALIHTARQWPPAKSTL